MLLVRYRIGVLEDWLATGDSTWPCASARARGGRHRGGRETSRPDGLRHRRLFIVLTLLFLYGLLLAAPTPANRAVARVAGPTPSPPVLAGAGHDHPACGGSAAPAARGQTRTPGMAAGPRGASLPRRGTESGTPGPAWCWWDRLGFLLAKGLSTASTSTFPSTRPWPSRRPLGPRPSTSRGWSSGSSTRPRTVWTSGSPGSLRVRSSSKHHQPPDLFQAEIPVIAVGHFHGSLRLRPDPGQALVDYIAAHPGRVTAERDQAMTAGPAGRRVTPRPAPT